MGRVDDVLNVSRLRLQSRKELKERLCVFDVKMHIDIFKGERFQVD
jgi:hypothetical protein